MKYKFPILFSITIFAFGLMSAVHPASADTNQCPALPPWNGIAPDGKPAWAGMENGQPLVVGSVNPYAITGAGDYRSRSVADQVAFYLKGTVTKNLTDQIKAFWVGDPSAVANLPDSWQVSIGGKEYAANGLAQALNEYSPDSLHVFLASQGITTIGPAPLPACMSYVSNYTRNPSATDPGPLPAYVACKCASATPTAPQTPVPTSSIPVSTQTSPSTSTGGAYSNGDIVSPTATQSTQKQGIDVSNKINAIGTNLINSAFQQFNTILGLPGGTNTSTNTNTTTPPASTGTPTTTGSSGGCYALNNDLRLGSSGPDVVNLTTVLVQQGFLNATQVTFDQTVYSAVVAYQNKYKDAILTPNNLTSGTGFVGPSTRAMINQQLDCSTSTSATPSVPAPLAVIPGQFRYLRISSTETGWISWREIEVYDNTGNKISIPGSAVTASSQWLGISPHLENNQPANVVSGNHDTGIDNSVWNAGNTKGGGPNGTCYLYPQGGGTKCDKALGVPGDVTSSDVNKFLGHEVAWIMLDLGSVQNVSKIRLQENGPATDGETDTIEVSNDGINFVTVAQVVPYQIQADSWFEYPTTDKHVYVMLPTK